MMKRFAALAAVLLLLCVGGFALAEEAGTAPDEWTVLFYFCGADLESKYGYASEDLVEIGGVRFPYDFTDLEKPGMVRDFGKVNILVETGGAREWHGKKDGPYASAGSLQRWQHDYFRPLTQFLGPEENKLELLETLPVQNMAAAETLADFIRWGAEKCPAKKYALVMWGHGNGAKTGLFVDELFGNDVMYLYELKQALADSGVHLETVVMDACLMSNLETAWAIKDSADWMVASEELVPGAGTAVDEWLQTLVNYPGLDGRALGRCICDLTAVKYANKPDEMSRALLTWSVVDLKRIDRVMEAFDHLFSTVGEAVKHSAMQTRAYGSMLLEAEEYGDGQQNMRDLGNLAYQKTIANFVDTKVLEELITALYEAVDYNVRGPGRSEARGLSFCYPAGSSDEELDQYAKNFPIPSYLAYLDAISTWNAPEEIYTRTERLPGIDTIPEMQVVMEKKIAANGMPALSFPLTDLMVRNVDYSLYRLDEETNEVVLMGKTNCGAMLDENNGVIWMADDGMRWLTLDGSPCCARLIKHDFGMCLYDIPVQINSETVSFRCGKITSLDMNTGKGTDRFEVYGVWEGYDENTSVMSRGVTPEAMLVGRTYRLLYPKTVTGRDGKVFYAHGESRTMPRSLELEMQPLPAGTYYLQYELSDAFKRVSRLEKIEIRWDGERMMFPEGFTWEGSSRVEWEY